MSRIANHFFTALALSLLAAAFTGCGSGNKEGYPYVVAPVGDTQCIQCHSSVTEALTGETIVAQYQRSSAHNKPGLGCESCHGGGAMHNGVGPIPFPNPDANVCAGCHNGTTATATNANTAFAASNHATQTIRTGVTCKRCHSHEGAVLSNIAGYTGGSVILDDPTNQGRVPLVANYTQITCATCHEHGGGLRTVKATDGPAGNVVNWDPNNNRLIDQFDLCTSCHSFYNYNGSQLLVDGSTLTGGIVTGSIATRHNDEWYRILASTHFDNQNTGLGANSVLVGPANVIEGYNVRRTGANACFDCHGHEAKTETRNASRIPPTASTIHTDWAKSAHAGGLLQQKIDAVGASTGAAAVAAAMNAGVTDASGPGWAHYNWDQTTGTGNRAACQRCHTSTGLMNFANNPAGYNPANNNFAHLSGWTAAAGSPQNELLYCWGCHTNAGKGTIRNPGAITETYSPGTAGDPPTTVSYPNIAGSNICMSCHIGRETGDVIKNDQDADGVRSFINSHYLTAGGQLFGTTGYEYAGRSYANPSFFAHDKIGLAAAPGTGTNGPCAGCHMTTPNSHSFLPVTKDAATGAITAINSSSCASCHSGGFALTPAGLTTEEEEYRAALTALTATLDSKGIFFFNAHPYFYAGPGGTLGAFTNWAGVYGFALWKDVMGAAFNANLLIHDPGGYVHNRFYSKRLIWDSIDFIYDGVLNNDVTAAIDAQVAALRLDAAVAAAAKTYLGATRP